MFDTVFGLPLHPLVVHATVVMVPLATLAVLLAGVWPRFRAWAGWLPLALSLVAVVLTPLSTQSGEPFEQRVAPSALVEEHAQLADGLLPWVLGLLVAAAVTTVIWRRERGVVGALDTAASALPRWLAVTAIALAVITSVGTTQQVVRIGHSGAQAAWSDVGGSTNAPAAARP